MLLDGSADADRRLQSMISWDVNNGIARRAWARNEPALFAIREAMKRDPEMKITLPNQVQESLLDRFGDEGEKE
jgi:urocanate hydratase